MRLRIGMLALAAFVVVSCNDHSVTAPRPTLLADHVGSHPSVRISELHYDNVGTDAGEAIEISGPAGTDLAGWSVVLYNGNGGAVYNTRLIAAPATIADQCTGRGTFVLTYPSNGIQNGNPDAVALVNGSGTVIEFLSYGGTQVGVGGPAAGMTSTDIGVVEGTSTPVGHSLQRKGDGTWSAPAANTFNACNDNAPPPPPAVVVDVVIAPPSATVVAGGTQAFTASAFDAASAPVATTFTWSSLDPQVATVDANGLATGVAPGDARIVATAPNGVADTAELHVDPAPPPGGGTARFSEIHYDNAGTDQGEAIEIEGDAGINLSGWSIVLYNGSNNAVYNTRALSGIIPDQCGGRGTLVFNYPQDGIQNGSPDGFALVDGAGQLVEFLSYEGGMTGSGGPANGVAATDIGVSEGTSAAVGGSLSRRTDGSWSPPAPNTFGQCNPTTPPPPAFVFQFSGRDPVGDPPLPISFQDQIFVTVRDGSGQAIVTTVTWSSDSPLIASIDEDGVITGLAAGTAVLRATTVEGTATFSLPVAVATASSTALYAGNAEFGEPADGDATDDILVRRDQYTASYNPVRRIPNWVSYNIDPTHFGPQDRCDCFTFDPALPAPLTRYTTADYTGAGAIAGYGIDRGHLARSFDRTSGSLDNATTYYFTNIIPQASDNNQGPWANMENFLGDQARFAGREVYVIAGGAGSKGTLKNEGLITIPAHTWKVAVLLPHDQGLASIDSWDDLEVIAVIMPNDPGIRFVDWNTYRTTVDAVEAISGYDLLALLPDQVEIAVESNTRPPVAALDGPYTGAEGSSITMSAAASTDADGHALTFVWTFGDGATATGATVSHTYAQNGSYTVRVAATDILGLTDDAVTTATVANVAPAIAPFAGATLLPGETYTASGSFTDPGADTWSAIVNYGDGSGMQALALSGKSFSLSHTYNAAGSFTVTVSVTDGEDTGTRSQTVLVMTPAQGMQAAMVMVGQLAAAGRLANNDAGQITRKLELAIEQLATGNTIPALNQLEWVLRELNRLVGLGRLSAADADPIRSLVTRIMASIEAND